MIASLAFYCPDDLSDSQWAHCIDWTWQLNANSAAIPPFMPTADLQRIVEELDSKIDAGPDLATIDWIWIEYDRSSAVDYQHCRPTLAKNWDDLQKREEAWGRDEDPLLRYKIMYEERARR